MKKKLAAGLMALAMLFSNGFCIARAAEPQEKGSAEYSFVELPEK